MALTKQKIKEIVETKTNKSYDEWKDEKLEAHMLMMMKKDKDYKQWEEKFIEEKVIELLINEAEKESKRQVRGQSNVGGDQ